MFILSKVVSNDGLFAGESSYNEELGNFVVDLVKSISSNSDGLQGRVSGNSIIYCSIGCKASFEWEFKK